MCSLERIRKRLGMTQSELASALGVSQASVSFYENGKTIPPEVARRLIEHAGSLGHEVTFDDVYAVTAPQEAA